MLLHLGLCLAGIAAYLMWASWLGREAVRRDLEDPIEVVILSPAPGTRDNGWTWHDDAEVELLLREQ